MTVIVRREDPHSQDAQTLLDELSATLALYSGDGGRSRFSVEEFCSARGAFVVARTVQGVPLGCGAFRRHDDGVAELKRIYSRPNSLGVGAAILQMLEVEAVTAGYRTLVAETRAINRRAIAFYERNGFTRVERFGIYATQSDAHCFAKQLAEATGSDQMAGKHLGNDSTTRGERD
ncbi:GNAT family N-acetyltransferase [Paraburkholderia sp. LEh10]|jgi:ribosomal protein S18 acetylase RimI-like enzyme|uniref:GNAT family N-acetyltransferase n=1 Tax=Paraburkholderia sp. LEh10 TaxID=2821353 RepID=UPI001AE6099B|nr:GNAT family N-acetyltransferase [Paraburkholderia sp. LEh10]MBP0588293.1 GNAT family N-acetyltransferase [Paraburkholderia sp. LEh10]